jgi:MFS family permease
MVLKRVRPSIWLSSLIISWGIVMTCMGVVKNFKGLVACRVILGLCEAGFFPGGKLEDYTPVILEEYLQ